jgi:hypothetical protein
MQKHQTYKNAINLRIAVLVTAIGAIGIGASPTPSPPATEDSAAAGRAEMQNAMRSLAPHPSIDTYLVEFSVGGINYRIPRNYLTTMDNWNGGPQPLVTLTINLSNMKPFSKESFDCFTSKATERPPGCEPFSFRINAPGGPSADEVLERGRDSFHSQTPMLGPFGFEEYESGPTNARTEWYKKTENGRTRLYRCHFVGDTSERHGLCLPVSDAATTGAEIKFFFSPAHLGDITEIDANLRKLVEGFTVQPGHEK